MKIKIREGLETITQNIHEKVSNIFNIIFTVMIIVITLNCTSPNCLRGNTILSCIDETTLT